MTGDYVNVTDYESRVASLLRVIAADGSLTEANRKAIAGYHTHEVIGGRAPAKRLRTLYELRMLGRWLGKDFASATRGDMEALVLRVETETYERNGITRPYSGSSRRAFKIALRMLFRWLRGTPEFPEEVRWIRAPPIRRTKLPEELLSEAEVAGLLQAAGCARDRALIAVLYESGVRASELLGLRIKHARFDELGLQIVVTGKTGARRVRLIAAAPYVRTWLEEHPRGDEPEAPLWVLEHDPDRHVGWPALRAVLRRAAHRAKVKKRVNPHNFRHSRATALASHMTESVMKEVFGWARGSDMPATYVHLSGRDVDRAVLATYGLTLPDEPQQLLLRPKRCHRCRRENEASRKWCGGCSAPLDERAAAEVVAAEMGQRKAEHLLEWLLEDADVQEMLRAKLRELVRRRPALDQGAVPAAAGVGAAVYEETDALVGDQPEPAHRGHRAQEEPHRRLPQLQSATHPLEDVREPEDAPWRRHVVERKERVEGDDLE